MTAFGMGPGLAACAVSLLGIGGCAVGGEDVDRTAGVELQIRQQFPEQARRTLGAAVIVNNVTCTETTDTTFDCLASVRGPDLRGRLVNQNVPIDASCDEQQCIWSVKGF